VRPHDLPGGVAGGGDDDGDLAQVEEHEGPVAAREAAQGAVRERAEEVVEAADDGEPPGARREP
jgi:hypothetical protein